MKKLFLATIAVALAHFTPALADAGSAASTAAAAPAVSSSAQPVTAAAPANLPSGCQDVVKLSRAQVSEDIILNFIHNSGASPLMLFSRYGSSPLLYTSLRRVGAFFS